MKEAVKLTGDVKQRKQYKNGAVNTMEPKRTRYKTKKKFTGSYNEVNPFS